MAHDEELAFNGSELSDEQILSLQENTDLRRLIIWGGPITNDRLAPISRLTWLTGLVLGEMPVDDGVLEHVAPLSRLENLILAYTNIEGDLTGLTGLPLTDVRLEGCRRVGDLCARSLAKFPKLRQLEIHMTGVTDRGLESLAESELEVLWLGPRITDDGMKTVGSMRRMKHLDVCAHLVTDEGVRAIAELPDLEVLWLPGCRITDESVETIGSMKKLRELNVQRTEITDSGLARIRRILPNCRIVDSE